MYLELRFLGLTLLLVCVLARDIVVDKNDERFQRYLKKYRRTSATVEKDNRPVAVPYRGRFTGGSYSYSRSRYTTDTGYDANDIEKQEERIKQDRERWQETIQRRDEQERLEKERQEIEKSQQQVQQRKEALRLQQQQEEEQQRRERERLQQQEEQQRRDRERLQQQQQEEQEKREKERLDKQQQGEQQRREREQLQQQQQEEQQRRERERLQQQQQEEQQRRERERLQQQQQEEQQRRERERLQQQQQEEQQRRERERLQQQKQEAQQRQEQQRKVEQDRADRERRHEESQRAIEQQRFERDRRAREERQRLIEIERKRREQEQREKQEAERRRQQQEYEDAIRKQKEEHERQEKARKSEEERRRQDGGTRQREEEERKRQEEESRRREEEQRRQQTSEAERRRQQQQQQRQKQPQAGGVVVQGQTQGHGQSQGPADVNFVRATLRSELEGIVREMRNQYEHSVSGRNTLASISRQLEVLLGKLNEQMQQDPTDDTRNVKQQFEYWMRRLEQMAREDTLNCETAKREITSLKDKVDYVERLIVHQGHSRGSHYRRSTTPRPPTVPEDPARNNQEQLNALTLQRPAEVSQPWQQQQQQQEQQQQGHHHTGHNQGSWRKDPHVDKWLPATRERYNTRMAASKRREQHMKKMKDESKRKAEQMVRGLQEANKKPWKPRRDRRPSQGLTGLLDRRVVNQAEVDPTDAFWIEEHNAPRTIVVDSPGIKHPDWLIRQGQQRSSYTNGNRLKQINVYHQSSHEGSRTGDDGRLVGDQESNVRITDYQAPHQVPPQPQSYSRKTHNTAGSCPNYVEKLGPAQTVRKVTNPMIGAWMKDTAQPDPRVWAIEHSNALHWNEIMEYSNEDDFINKRSPVRHRLPERCSGLGAVVYNGDLYCQLFAHLKKLKPTVVRIRLEGDVLLSRVELPGKQIGTKGWAGAYMAVQLSADSSGIWALFAGEDELLNIFQLDTNLNKLQGWRTTIAKDSVGPAFMVCGVLYALDSHYANSVAYMYDTALSQGRHLTSNKIVIPFEDMATLHYNPTDGTLYMWTLEREEKRNRGRSKFRFASRAKVYGVAERLPVHLSKVKLHM